MTTFFDLAASRYSVRSYANTPISPEILETVLTAGTIAPSACNIQPWTFIVVTSEEVRQGMGSVYIRDWFLTAPVYIIVCVSKSAAWKRADGLSYAMVDAALAMDHMILAATEQGLGTCFIAAFDRNAAVQLLRIPADWEPILITPLGYPLATPPQKKRKLLSDVVRWEHF